MVKNRNGYWMSPGFQAMFAPDDGGGNGGAAGGEGNPAGNDPDNGGAGGEKNPEGDASGAESIDSLKAQLEQTRAEMAKQKAALDKATKEAGDARKQLKAKMTQEEIDAASKKEAEEKAAQELEDLRKEVARAKTTKSVMAKLGVDEETAGTIADCLFGCEDVDNALLLIQKSWEAKEKKLRLEYGKVPPPGAGGGSEDKEAQEALALAKELGQRKAKNSESVRAQLGGLVR